MCNVQIKAQIFNEEKKKPHLFTEDRNRMRSNRMMRKEGLGLTDGGAPPALPGPMR